MKDIDLTAMRDGDNRLGDRTINRDSNHTYSGIENYDIRVHGYSVAEYSYAVDRKPRESLGGGIEQYRLKAREVTRAGEGRMELTLSEDAAGNTTIRAKTPDKTHEGDGRRAPLGEFNQSDQQWIANAFNFGEQK